MNKPFFSVVIPVFNSQSYIKDTLMSVFRQTYDNYEVIVCDDGSTDKTVTVVRDVFNNFCKVKVKLLCNNHKGPGATRNKGIETAQGVWIAFLDADDRWEAVKLERVAACIERNREQVDLICHSEVWQDGLEKKQVNYRNCFNRKIHPFLSLYGRNAFSTSAVTVKKELLLKAGGFDITLPSSQDYDLWLRLALLPEIKIEFIEKSLGFYITRQGSISANIEQRLRCLLLIGSKYARQIKSLSNFPFRELMIFRSNAYVGAGFSLINRKKIFKGIFFLIVGLLIWPRFDWVGRIFKKAFTYDR